MPTSLLKEKEKAEKLGVKAYRLSFTIETQQETEKIVRAFVDVYLRGQKPDGRCRQKRQPKDISSEVWNRQKVEEMQWKM